jgi:hypothetical protein
MVLLRELTDVEDLLRRPIAAQAVIDSLKDGDLFVLRNYFDSERVAAIRNYLATVGRSSIPNYHAIEAGAPNFHRINRWDPRAHVQGCFHQFSFFPWNDDVLDLFATTRRIYELKNVLSGNPAERFLEQPHSENYAPRLSFQFYPAGTGGLHRHSDPVSTHQVTVPVMTMSAKGTDFAEGGLFVDVRGERVMVDDVTQPGDVVFFYAGLPHGVESIDPDSSAPWLQFEGRWMLLFALNHIGVPSQRIDARDLET